MASLLALGGASGESGSAVSLASNRPPRSPRSRRRRARGRGSLDPPRRRPFPGVDCACFRRGGRRVRSPPVLPRSTAVSPSARWGSSRRSPRPHRSFHSRSTLRAGRTEHAAMDRDWARDPGGDHRAFTRASGVEPAIAEAGAGLAVSPLSGSAASSSESTPVPTRARSGPSPQPGATSVTIAVVVGSLVSRVSGDALR